MPRDTKRRIRKDKQAKVDGQITPPNDQRTRNRSQQSLSPSHRSNPAWLLTYWAITAAIRGTKCFAVVEFWEPQVLKNQGGAI